MDIESTDDVHLLAMRGELKSTIKKEKEIKTSQDYFKKAPRIKDIGKFMLSRVLNDMKPLFNK